MVKEEIHVEGFDAFTEAYSKYKGQLVFALFCGSVNADGKSWCPDCIVGQYIKGLHMCTLDGNSNNHSVFQRIIKFPVKKSVLIVSVLIVSLIILMCGQ